MLSHKKLSSSKGLSLEKSEYSSEKPSPLNFDTFIPWVCLQWRTPTDVTVTRVLQDIRKISSKSTKSTKSKQDDFDIKQINKSTNSPTKIFSPESISITRILNKPINNNTNTIPIKAVYDTCGHLVEISIIGCSVNIPRKVIQAINLCVCFHSFLNKFTIAKGGLSSLTIYEISKMLPVSNITEICMDDSNVSQQNYYILLDQISQLKTLSLNRCQLRDEGCASIASRLNFGSSGCSLVTLELGSNDITDVGANAIGDALRNNRRLLHLGLGGNAITDIGALAIFKHFMEFPLTSEEVLETRRRKVKFFENKMAIYKRCLHEALLKQRSELQENNQSGNKLHCNKNKSPRKSKKSTHHLQSRNNSEHSCQLIAENMATDIVGEFSDPYDDSNVVLRDGYSYSIGNMFLCSLNFAYNNLTYCSVKKLWDVLKYQEGATKPRGASGLLRVVLDGNYLPETCIDYYKMNLRLHHATTNFSPVPLNLQKKKKQSNYSLKKVFYSPSDL